MWFERKLDALSEEAAVGLELAELVAMQPRHFRGPRGSGRRGPGGERAGRGRAQSLDFDGISPYQIGDDVRWIDWRATARHGETQMRRFAAESHRARMVVVDLHPAVYFGSRGHLMAKTAALVAARLCWQALAWQEPVGLAVDATEGALGPRRGKRHVLRLLELLRLGYIAGRDGTAEPNPSELLQAASAWLGKADEICLVSDFGDLSEEFTRLSDRLAGHKKLRAFVVEDPLFRAALPAGRYPMRDSSGRIRSTATIGPGSPEAPRTSEDLRRARDDGLRDLGWEVVDALDLLPRQTEPWP